MGKTPFEQFKNNAVIISGYPKSGTTLLQSLLDYHPQLLVFPEEMKYFKNTPAIHKSLIKIIEWKI